MSEQPNQVLVLWTEIVGLLKDPSVCNAGATEAQILKLSSVLGKELPASYRAFLEICNGLEAGGFMQLSPTPLSIEQMSRTLSNRAKLNIKSNRVTVFDAHSKASQAFGKWPSELLQISSCDDMGHAIDLESGKIFFFDYIEGGHVKFQFESFEELLKNTIALFQSGKKGIFGGLISTNS